MENNIVTAVFGAFKETRTRKLWQWDYGMTLRFVGLDLPPSYTVHQANEPMSGSAKTRLGDETGVDILDEYLTTGKNVYVWLYLHSGDSDGETVYMVTIPVQQRPRPTEDEPTPVQQGLIEQALAALNAGVAEAEAAAELLSHPGAEAATLEPGSAATAGYQDGVFSFGIPQGEQGVPGQDGQDGQDGHDGADGVSPTVTVTDITGGHRVSVTDADGTQTFDVMDGEDGHGVPAGGTARQIIQKSGTTDYDVEWANNPADMIAAVQPDATAEQAYDTGDVFVYNNKLYKADEAIASGATIVPGTNCHETTVEAEIKNALTIKSGSGKPTTSTKADYIGQLYKNTAENFYDYYICVEINNGTYTWRRIFVSNDNLGAINLLGTPTVGEANNVFLGRQSGPLDNGSYATYSIAIGAFAKSSSQRIQLGMGENRKSKTFQVWDYRLLDDDGTIPPERITSANWTDAQRLAVLASLGCTVDENGFVKWAATPSV